MFSRPPLSPIAFWGVSWYAILIVLGVALAVMLCFREEKRLGLPKDTALDFSLVVLPLGIIGARLYYVLFNLDYYLEEPLRIFAIRNGGVAIFGGILAGLLGAFLVARHKKLPLTKLMDMVAPGLVLAQGIGRWGNYFNMEAYGLRLSEEFASLRFFPFAVEIPMRGGEFWYWQMATFFYEFVVCALVFVALMLFRKHQKRSGDVFWWYLLLYCAGRTVIEGLRTDSLTFINDSVRISQILAALACVAVVILFSARVFPPAKRRLALPLGIGMGLLCLATCFLGEFERGAYANLFGTSQLFSLLTLLGGVAACAALWFAYRPVKATWLLPEAVLAALWIFCLVYGLGRQEADNVLYVSFRQILSMLQLIVFGQLLYRFNPNEMEAKHA